MRRATSSSVSPRSWRARRRGFSPYISAMASKCVVLQQDMCPLAATRGAPSSCGRLIQTATFPAVRGGTSLLWKTSAETGLDIRGDRLRVTHLLRGAVTNPNGTDRKFTAPPGPQRNVAAGRGTTTPGRSCQRPCMGHRRGRSGSRTRIGRTADRGGSMDPKKCAHEPCTCQPREGSKYCSESCEQSSGTIHIKCNCGHPGCR